MEILKSQWKKLNPLKPKRNKVEFKIHWECVIGKKKKCHDKAEYLDKKIREIYEWQLDPEYVHNKLLNLQGSSWKNNLRINEIKVKDRESGSIVKLK